MKSIIKFFKMSRSLTVYLQGAAPVGLAQMQFGCPGFPGGWFGFGGLGIFAGIISLIIWIAVIVGIVYLIKYLVSGEHYGGRENRSMEILRERYAKGEITKEEYESRKEDLRKM